MTQSGRAWLPDVTEPQGIPELLASLSKEVRILLGDDKGSTFKLEGNTPGVCLAVGPEGGFSAEEIALFDSHDNVSHIAIGRHRLRAETAVVAMLSVVESQISE